MKKYFFLLTMIVLAVAVNAQKYEDVKKLLILGKLSDAKQEVDKGMSNPKFTAKPEGYLLKATVYSDLALDPAQAAQSAQLREEAYNAFQKYRELDPKMSLLSDATYGNTPLNLHASFFNAGYKNYEEKKWPEGLTNFQRTVDLADLMIEHKLLEVPADTNSLILAGVMAENAHNDAEAARYYGRLAALKLDKPEFEDVYRYLVRYYAGQKDHTSFDKYKALGKELYPNSEFFDYDKVDFAIGMVDGFDSKLKALEELLAKEPDNYKANMILGELIYDTINSRKEGAVQPANAAELEARMIASFNKAATLKPEAAVHTYLYLGDHYMNKSDRELEVLTNLKSELKAKTKPGVKPNPADAQKVADQQKKYNDTYDKVRDNYEKVANIFSKKAELDRTEKRQYKIIAGNLAQYYSYKREGAKGAELAKYVAEEKKWNDLDEKLK